MILKDIWDTATTAVKRSAAGALVDFKTSGDNVVERVAKLPLTACKDAFNFLSAGTFLGQGTKLSKQTSMNFKEIQQDIAQAKADKLSDKFAALKKRTQKVDNAVEKAQKKLAKAKKGYDKVSEKEEKLKQAKQDLLDDYNVTVNEHDDGPER